MTMEHHYDETIKAYWAAGQPELAERAFIEMCKHSLAWLDGEDAEEEIIADEVERLASELEDELYIDDWPHEYELEQEHHDEVVSALIEKLEAAEREWQDWQKLEDADIIMAEWLTNLPTEADLPPIDWGQVQALYEKKEK